MPEWSEHLRPRLALLQLSAAREAEIIEELSQHLDQRYEELRRCGISDADARRLAIEELLEPDALAKHMRSLRQAHVPSPITLGAPNRFPLGDLWQDLRYAARMLRKQPGFAAAAVLTLALGLGANIAIFSLVYGLLIRSLPVDRPDELYRLGDTNRCCVSSGLPGSYSLFAFHLFEHLREATSDDFVELAAFDAQSPQPMVVRRGGDVAASLPGQYVSANYFQMFGVRPAAGRLLRPDDDRPGAEPVVVISHQAWTQRFGQDPSLVGSSILVYGRPMTVAGVAAQGFFGDTVRPNPAMLWIPLGQEPALRGEASLIDRVNQDWLYAIGRLRPGSEPEQAAMRATNALRQWIESQSFLSEEERVQLPQQHVKVVSAGGGVPVLQTQFGQVLTILFITSGLVLLIATANLANLLLARADRGQAAIRAALGASTGRLLRQSVTEGVFLGLVGGFVAIWVAAAGTRHCIFRSSRRTTGAPRTGTKPNDNSSVDAFVSSWAENWRGKDPLTARGVNGMVANNIASADIHDALGILAFYGDSHPDSSTQAALYETFERVWMDRVLVELQYFYATGTGWHEGSGGYLKEGHLNLGLPFALISSALGSNCILASTKSDRAPTRCVAAGSYGSTPDSTGSCSGIVTSKPRRHRRWSRRVCGWALASMYFAATGVRPLRSSSPGRRRGICTGMRPVPMADTSRCTSSAT